MEWFRGVVGWLGLCSAMGLASAEAHELNTSYSQIHVDETRTAIVLSIDEADLLRLFDLDTNSDGMLWAQELLRGADAAAAQLSRWIRAQTDDRELSLAVQDRQPDVDGDGNLFLRIRFEAEHEEGIPRQFHLDLDGFLQPLRDSGHKHLARLQVAGGGVEEILAVLSASQPRHTFTLSKESLAEQLVGFVWLGVEHIFIGYDHILFLVALIVIGGRLIGLVKIVTAFTVAHSLTLILATLEIVSLPGRIVESGIALSIAYVAAENLWAHRTDHRWILTFAFGFVHGFGFANVLRDLGLPTRGLVGSLLAFNVGVEIGQVIIVAVLFPGVLWMGRSSQRDRWVRGMSLVILLFGLGWLVERVFDFGFMPM
ncbi:MAG: HupE/UreJ family protein [Candidatus Latescibacterota bacterium]|nr:HupE/UreJ family protein [Candidatus Latescibacterota bacterium]